MGQAIWPEGSQSDRGPGAGQSAPGIPAASPRGVCCGAETQYPLWRCLAPSGPFQAILRNGVAGCTITRLCSKVNAAT